MLAAFFLEFTKGVKMKLLKSDLVFEVAGLEGGLDIWVDADNGNEVGENNAWIVVSDIYKWWGIPQQTISDLLKDRRFECNKVLYKFPTVTDETDVLYNQKYTGLVTNRSVIEALAKTKTAVFDKTGTLTKNEMSVFTVLTGNSKKELQQKYNRHLREQGHCL